MCVKCFRFTSYCINMNGPAVPHAHVDSNFIPLSLWATKFYPKEFKTSLVSKAISIYLAYKGCELVFAGGVYPPPLFLFKQYAYSAYSV